MQTYDRLPPQNQGAERAVLGSCLLGQQPLGVALEILKPEDFYDLNHSSLFQVMAALYNANRPADLVTVEEELKKLGVWDKIGGQPFMAALIAEVPTTANISYHAEIVREKSIRRRLIEAGSRIASLGYSSSLEGAMIMDEAERTIFELSQHNNSANFRHVGELLTGTLKIISERMQASGSQVQGFESGFSDLDRLTGGFQPGSLNIIAARPSMGKTAFALNIAQFGGGAAREPILIFSLEMSAEQLVLRMLGAEAELNINTMVSKGVMGSKDWQELKMAASELMQKPIYIDDSSMLTTMDFRARCRRFKSRYNSIGLVIVDYLQLMTFGGRSTDNRQQEVSEISRMLKGVARELECPVIALSQLSRETEKRQDKKPMLSDLRDSGAIEQDADIVMFLYRPGYYQESTPGMDEEASLIVAKNRNGPTDTVHLIFRREITRFANALQHGQGWQG